MKFNTIHPALAFVCPSCGAQLSSGVGFRIGAILRHNYKLGDELIWDGAECRPNTPPVHGNIETVGYFNCDNPACKSWTDCFPEVQHALVTVQNNRIVKVEKFELPSDAEIDEFAIIEMS